jgi:hypothetical protein
MMDDDSMEYMTYLVRLFSTDVSYKPQHVYLFSHQVTDDLYERMFTCLQGYKDLQLYFLDSPPGLSGCMGYEWACALAKTYGFVKCHPVPFTPTDMVNTFTESQAVVSFFHGRNIQRYHICSPAFHLPRALHSMISNQLSAAVYVLNGTIRDWDKEIRHSQGTLQDSVSNLCRHEYVRSRTYQKKGDLVSFGKCLKYMGTHWVSAVGSERRALCNSGAQSEQ